MRGLGSEGAGASSTNLRALTASTLARRRRRGVRRGGSIPGWQSVEAPQPQKHPNQTLHTPTRITQIRSYKKKGENEERRITTEKGERKGVSRRGENTIARLACLSTRAAAATAANAAAAAAAICRCHSAAAIPATIRVPRRCYCAVLLYYSGACPAALEARQTAGSGASAQSHAATPSSTAPPSAAPRSDSASSASNAAM